MNLLLLFFQSTCFAHRCLPHVLSHELRLNDWSVTLLPCPVNGQHAAQWRF